MVKDFWQAVFIFVAFWVIVIIYVRVTESKPITSNLTTSGTLLKNQTYRLNLNYPEDARECLRDYQNKLDEYEFAITEAQNHLDEAYGSPPPSYSELFEIIEATHDELDINVLDRPNCY